MKTIKLSLRGENDDVVSNVVGEFSEDELSLLRSYRECMPRVRTSTLLERGMPAITNMSLNNETGMTFTCAPYTNPELYELLHVLRPITLESESASFYKVSALLTRRFADRSFSDYVKTLRRVYDHGELSLFMQVTLNNQPLLDRSLLHTYLNGTQYHTDAEKVVVWAKIERALTVENARALVMNQLQSKVKSLFNLEYLCSLVLQ